MAYHHGDLARAALEAAIRDVETRGAAALSLRVLAAQLGVTHRALFRHYPDKQALLAAVRARAFEDLASVTAPACDDAESFCRAYIAFALARRNLYALMMSTQMAARPQDRDRAVDTVIANARRALGDDSRVKRVWMMLHGGLSLHATATLAARSDAELVEFLVDAALSD